MFVPVKDSLLSRHTSDHEMRLGAAFFGNSKGYFVEVGANDPQELANMACRAGRLDRRPDRAAT
jgi:hypothetical protein